MDKFDIILEAGQSNAEGYGHGPAAEPYVPDPRILYFTAEDPPAGAYAPKGEPEIRIAAERPHPDLAEGDLRGDLTLSFAQKYVEEGLLEPDRKLLIVRTAVGGTGFLKGYWRKGDPLYQRMLRMTDGALALHPQNRLVAMLWHQGEHEAAFQNDPERYRGQLTEVLESVRTRYALPNLPIICGGFCREWAEENQPYCDDVMAVIRQVTEALGGSYVETADLRSNNQKVGDGDTIHFCREDLQELGRRYFAAFTRLTGR